MLGQLGHIMASVADSIMVGQLGTHPLAAVALAGSIVSIFMLFGIGAAMGITPLVSNAEGRQQKRLQASLHFHGHITYLCIGICLFLLSAASIALLPFMGQDTTVVDITRPYMFLIALSIVPLMVFLSFKQFAEGLSYTRVAMQVSIACNLLNVGLNYLLIFGKMGFPELGIIGAGYATLIARIAMALSMGIYVLYHRRFAVYGLRFSGLAFRKKVLRRILQVSLPTGLQFIFEVSAFSLAAIFAGMIGAQALASHQIAINIASVSYMAVTGIGAAAAVRVGNQVGSRDSVNLRKAARSIFGMSLMWMSFSGLIIFLFRMQLAGFYSDDPEVIQLAVSMLLIAVVFQLSDGLQSVSLGALRGFTDVRVPTFITFIAYWLLTLPAAYVLSQHTALGAIGIWLALAFGLTISAISLISRFYTLMKRFDRSGLRPLMPKS